jgi:hypothetical protein
MRNFRIDQIGALPGMGGAPVSRPRRIPVLAEAAPFEAMTNG